MYSVFDDINYVIHNLKKVGFFKFGRMGGGGGGGWRGTR